MSTDSPSTLSQQQKQYFRKLGHDLSPVVTIGGKGLSETVLAELQRALNDHELIKIKINVDDRKAMIDDVCQQTGAQLVQAIGATALVFKAAERPNPKLSNLLRQR